MKTILRILDIVSHLAGVTRHVIMMKRKFKRTVAARHVCAWLLHRCFGLSQPECAIVLKLDHTSVGHACRMVDRDIRNGNGARGALLLESIGALAEAT